MATKNINARIKNKRDTAANWEKNNPVLLNGEIIIVDTSAGEVRQKTGDGIKTYTQLPFDDEAIKAQITNHINNKSNPHQVTATQIGALPNPTGVAGQYLAFISDNVVGAVEPPLTTGSYFNKSFTGTLSTTWQGSSAPYYQQFNISDMKSSVCPLVFPQWSSIPPSTAQSEAWNSINGAVQSFDGYVRFYTNKKTTTTVNFILYYGNLVNPTGGEPVSLIDNNANPPIVRNGQFFEEV